MPKFAEPTLLSICQLLTDLEYNIQVLQTLLKYFEIMGTARIFCTIFGLFLIIFYFIIRFFLTHTRGIPDIPPALYWYF
jgi:hypothetical protein